MDTKIGFKDFFVKNKRRLIVLLIVSLVAALISAAIYTAVLRLTYGSWTLTARVLYSPDTLIRAVFFFALYIFIGSCFAFDRRTIFDFIFKNRWYIAGCVFAALVLLNINFSSVGEFNKYVQPDILTDTTLPIFGIPRDIRSDEWLVYVPRAFTSDFEGFDKFNYIVRATENFSISANGLKLGWSALCSPMSWGYYLFGAERGLSFYWSFLMVMSFMASYEFSLIISNGSKRLAFFGAAFIGFSQFSMWWSVCTYLISAQMLIVSAYYFFGERRIGRKILYAIVAAFSATLFITKLYPAWQVPCGYLLIGLIVWLIITKRKEIKESRWYDLVIIGAAFALMVSFVLAYLMDTQAANKTLLSTVYPGERFEVGGDELGRFKAASFLHTLRIPFRFVGNGTNNSEVGMFFSLFPLPMIFSVYTLIHQIIRKRHDKEAKIDVFNIAVLIPTLFLFVYAVFGVPAWLAKYSLLSYSMGARVADFLGLANLYLLIRHISNKDERIHIAFFVPTASLCAVLWVYATYRTVPGYMPVWYCILATVLALGLAFIAYCKIPERISAPSVISVSALACIIGLCVHPVMHGADALVEKPMALAVRAEVQKDSDAKWIGYGDRFVGQYLIANGAPTINSVNYIPNLEFWHRFDPEGEDEFIYNRYAHVTMRFTDEETKMELAFLDYITVDINYGDLKKTEAEYVASIDGEIDFGLSKEELFEKYGLEFDLIYSESDSCIYKIIYH